MGYYTTPAALAKRQRARFAQAGKDMRKVHDILATSGHRDFLSQTSGRIAEKTLAAMGHPFAKNSALAGAQRGIRSGTGKQFMRAGKKGQVRRNGVVNRLPINRQTGKLRRGIRLVGPARNRQRTYELASHVPYAKYVLSLTGTRYMVPRGLLGPNGVLRKRHKARVQTHIDVVRLSLRKP